MASALGGKVDQVLLTGGIAYSEEVTEELRAASVDRPR